MADKVTAPAIRAMKQSGEKIVCVTAYDSATGAIADEAGVDLVLVGDSVGNVMLGYDSTVPVTLDQMIHHTRATRAGVRRALFVSDLPFGSYGATVGQAVQSAVELMKAGAEAVKLEGTYLDEIRALVKVGIPVMGHLGMTPQSVNVFGGPKVQGRGDRSAAIVEAAEAIADAGAFAMVLELIPADLSAVITSRVASATIGIGAGIGCDGQIQVFHDLLGLSGMTFKHAKVYVEGRRLLREGLSQYAQDVRDGIFPGKENSFS